MGPTRAANSRRGRRQQCPRGGPPTHTAVAAPHDATSAKSVTSSVATRIPTTAMGSRVGNVALRRTAAAPRPTTAATARPSATRPDGCSRVDPRVGAPHAGKGTVSHRVDPKLARLCLARTASILTTPLCRRAVTAVRGRDGRHQRHLLPTTQLKRRGQHARHEVRDRPTSLSLWKPGGPCPATSAGRNPRRHGSPESPDVLCALRSRPAARAPVAVQRQQPATRVADVPHHATPRHHSKVDFENSPSGAAPHRIGGFLPDGQSDRREELERRRSWGFCCWRCWFSVPRAWLLSEPAFE